MVYISFLAVFLHYSIPLFINLIFLMFSLTDIIVSQSYLFKEGLPYEVFANLMISNSITQLNWQTSWESQASSCWVCSCDNYSSSPYKARVNCINNFIDNSTLVIFHQNRSFVESLFPFKCVGSGQLFSTSCHKVVIYGLYIPVKITIHCTYLLI